MITVTPAIAADCVQRVHDCDETFWASRVPAERVHHGESLLGLPQPRLWLPGPLTELLASQWSAWGLPTRGSARVLDAGAGQGRNAVYLLQAPLCGVADSQALARTVVAIEVRRAIVEKMVVFATTALYPDALTSVGGSGALPPPPLEDMSSGQPPPALEDCPIAEEDCAMAGSSDVLTPLAACNQPRPPSVRVFVGRGLDARFHDLADAAWRAHCGGGVDNEPINEGGCSHVLHAVRGNVLDFISYAQGQGGGTTSLSPPASSFNCLLFSRFLDRAALASAVTAAPALAAPEGCTLCVEAFHASAEHPAEACHKIERGELLALVHDALAVIPRQARGEGAPPPPRWRAALLHEALAAAEDGRPLLQVVIRIAPETATR